MPEVSVLIPTRNRRALLARTLGTVLRQREVDLEVVIVDDCSTDGTAAMVDGLGDGRLRLTRQPKRSGVSAARNRAIQESRGEWLAFLDDDDLWAPDKLVQQLDAAMALSRSWAFGGAMQVTPELAIISGREPPQADVARRLMPLRNMLPGGASNVLVHRRLLDQAGRFDEGLRHLADWDMWIRLSALAAPAVVAEPIVACLLHSANASADTEDAPGEMLVIEERYGHLRSQPRLERAFIYRWMGWHYFRCGQRHKGMQAYARAVGCGDVASVGRAMVGVIWPGLVARGRRPPRRDVEWRRRAGWLHELTAHESCVA